MISDSVRHAETESYCTQEAWSVSWIVEPSEAPELARWFVENLDVSYISHGEILCGRAICADRWAPGIEQVLCREICDALPSKADLGFWCRRIAVVKANSQTLGLGIVEFVLDSNPKLVHVHDMIVDRSYRSKGVGHYLFTWMEQQVRNEGASAMFCESGLKNHGAHTFIEKMGFEPISRVFTKNLQGAVEHDVN